MRRTSGAGGGDGGGIGRIAVEGVPANAGRANHSDLTGGATIVAVEPSGRVEAAVSRIPPASLLQQS